MAWFTGSPAGSLGSTSASDISWSLFAPARVWLNDTYVLSGECFCRADVLMAEMIWRCTHSSTNERNVVCLSLR